MNINDFGHNSFIGAIGLKERIKTMEAKYICLGTGQTFTEDELHQCSCGKYSCPTCGGEVSTIEEYDEAMKANA